MEVLRAEGLYKYAANRLNTDYVNAPQDIILYMTDKEAKRRVLRGLYDPYPSVAVFKGMEARAAWCGTIKSGQDENHRRDMMLAHVKMTASMGEQLCFVCGLGNVIDSLKSKRQKMRLGITN